MAGNPKKIKRGDTGKPLQMVIRDGTGRLVPLAPETPVWLVMAPAVAGMGRPTIKKPAIPVSDGRVDYYWEAEDLSVAGPFKVEVEVLTPTGPETFPTVGYQDVLILPDLG